jgi:hypothetical protein
VRADSERELSAASQRRDSINAQLANVRQMLATLTGTAAMPLTAFGAEEDTPADAPATEATDDSPEDSTEAAETSDASTVQTPEDAAEDEPAAECDQDEAREGSMVGERG